MKGKKMWTLERALQFIRRLENHLAPHYHVALTGGVMLNEFSRKDLDIMIFPHSTEYNDLGEIHLLLDSFSAGMKLRLPCETVHSLWRKMGSNDTKHVEVWNYFDRRVDVFLPYGETS